MVPTPLTVAVFTTVLFEVLATALVVPNPYTPSASAPAHITPSQRTRAGRRGSVVVGHRSIVSSGGGSPTRATDMGLEWIRLLWRGGAGGRFGAGRVDSEARLRRGLLVALRDDFVVTGSIRERCLIRGRDDPVGRG